MPVRAVKRGEKWRLVEPDNSIATTDKGVARDGGGHRSRVAAEMQASAINRGSKPRRASAGSSASGRR